MPAMNLSLIRLAAMALGLVFATSATLVPVSASAMAAKSSSTGRFVALFSEASQV